MTEYLATEATASQYELAEGILWDDRHELVRWVDIRKGHVLSGTLSGSRINAVQALEFAETTSAVALTEDGGLLVAGARGLLAVSADGMVSHGPDLLGDRTGVRLNDGSVDPHGRFVVGTLSLTGETGDEVLLRVTAAGSVEVLREGVRLSNGVAFSLDGGTIYHVDTLAGTVSQHSYASGPFDHAEPWVTVLGDLPDYPDGLTVDATGALWVAQWGGSRVLRHAPTGELLDVVTVDATQVSCAEFVGPQLDILAITTAQEGLATLTGRDGAIFVADVGVSGRLPSRWAGSTTSPFWQFNNEEESA